MYRTSRMNCFVFCFCCVMAVLMIASIATAGDSSIVFEGAPGSENASKHVVLISGDEEYRSEEALPMLAKILSQRYGFRCTVLFAINKKTGEIDPNVTDNIPGLKALETADLMFVFTRFRDLPDEQMKYVDAYLQTGKPIIGIRPSVVAFRNKPDSKYAKYSSRYKGKDFTSGFGRQVLGATWISHHGRHGRESTRGIPVESMKSHPIMRGVGVMWGRTDVYTVRSPIPHDGKVLVMGQTLSGMKPDAPPSPKAQMPLAWIKHFPTPKGNARVFMSTMGDAQDFRDESFRRMVVNACFWAMDLEDAIGQKTNVDTIVPFDPLPFGFKGFRKGLFPRDYATLPGPGAHTKPKPSQASFGIKEGDRICYIGNTLADRMQHFGWLETLVQSRLADKKLVFRNLGFSADELTIRPRSMNFGDPHAHLTHSKADVVFAFFGYNESFDGKDGIYSFRRNLAQFITETRKHKYNGKAPPRIVLFSPIAHENLNDPNLPDGSENNGRLTLYTEAMAGVANEHHVTFVDLFTPTQKLFTNAKQPLTINGIHLTNEGNRRVAEVIDTALFGGASQRDEARLEKVRTAVLNKNLRWFNRYRATDGYSTYGKRAFLKFVDGQTNYVVMQHELNMLDVMTANRDKGIWAAAQGSDYEIDDSNVPAPIKVISNVGGGSRSSSAAKEGSLKYLGGEEAIGKMKVAKGMRVNLFASEEQFPELINPVQSAVDTNGRLWVAAWTTYPHWHPNKPLNDKLLILPDENGDGKADRCIVFADELHNPTGFEFWNGGVLVANAPDILFLKDTDGDDKADVRIRLLHGIDSADTHCNANSFVFGPDGCIYFSEGIFHYTNVETPWGKPLRTKAPMLYRWNPRTGRITNHFRISPNPHGIAIDKWGYLFATDGTSGHGFYVGYPGKGTPHQLYRKRVRPVAGFGMISGTHFPEANRGNLLICNTIGFLGVLQHKRSVNGADITSQEVEPIVVSSDGNFRPVDVEIGGDGALYVVDWQNVIIGHMQHNIRDPNRDHVHGRIYRVTVPGRPLLKPVKMAGKPIDEVLRHLESPEDMVRYRARIELSGRNSKQVLAAAAKWAATFDPNNKDHAHHLTEALWLHEQHNTVNERLLRRVLKSPEPYARAAAVRVLGHWGDRVKDGVIVLQKAARDPEALVRAEAVVAAASFEGLGAAEVVFEAQNRPLDAQLKYAIDQTRRVTDPYWQQAVKEGKTLSHAGQVYVLRNASNRDLLKMQRSESVCRAIVNRGSIPQKDRADALQRLATFTHQTTGKILLDLIGQHAQTKSSVFTELVPMLYALPGAELAAIKPRLTSIARSDGNSKLRSAAIAALIQSGEPVDTVFRMAAVNSRGVLAFLNSVPLVADASRRSAMYSSIRPLVFDVPKHLKPDPAASSSKRGRYVRIEQSRKTILTLAEVQIFSQGQNIAPRGKASQSGISAGGLAQRAIDGRTDGNWKANSNTATSDQRNPWWEVDLGDAYPIEMITIWNRTDCCTDRLNGFKLTILDSGRAPIFVKARVPEPSPKVNIAVEGVAGVDVTTAAIRALKHIPNHDTEIFADMVALIDKGPNHAAAVSTILSINKKDWPKKHIAPLAQAITHRVQNTPIEKRDSGSFKQSIQIGRQLTTMLPTDQAERLRASLADLELTVIKIKTVLEQMKYDRAHFTVEAGKGIKLVLSNPDKMPHNLLIVLPNAAQIVGPMAEQMGADGFNKHFIPDSDKILHATKLLNTGESATLIFTAPTKPGLYEYVCTFPGHWRLMRGVMRVVTDLDAAQPYVPTITTHNWKTDELAKDLKSLDHGRSFEQGKDVFTKAGCLQCHRMRGEGGVLGPDLTEVHKRWKGKRIDVLREILEPSRVVEEKYRAHNITTVLGERLYGLISERGKKHLMIVTNPQNPVPQKIALDDIDSQTATSQSLMPMGILNAFNRDQILDLMAYMESGGDPEHGLFKE